ncbi:GAF domain-containing protein [Naasia lichenicola]|uniref:GAF domain-containing protein n=1 Tax=Naasia lichenicola TaxID=2565933 RepID=A0A4S4FNW6_9MICO|nr:GAF domain-containing protein [Naasia lichenicola]THG30966.1 GAF domain-containing protein [Naasia lichenicola]
MSRLIAHPARTGAVASLREALHSPTSHFRSPELDDIEVRPDAVAAVRRPGLRPYRVLLFGGGVLVGKGVRDHNLGLPGQVADHLSQIAGRGLDLDVVVEPDPTSARALHGLLGLRINRYDAVVVVLGARPAMAGVGDRSWQARLVALVRTLVAETVESAPVMVLDSARAMIEISGDLSRRGRVARLARQQGAITDRACALTTRISYLALAPQLQGPAIGTRFDNSTYRSWAAEIVAHLHPRLTELERIDPIVGPRAFRERPVDERLRQRALACLRLEQTDVDAALEMIVRQARSAFRADRASINIIEGGRQWQKAAVPADRSEIPRAEAICDIAVRSDELTLINDTHQDDRLAGNPQIAGPDGIRFYAGFPIHTWDGYRVGMLCITDRVPRMMRPSELASLRDLAGMVEKHLWEAALRRRAA